MPTVDEKLAKSLTADSTDLIPYLPYLLQDLWELGSTPETIINLARSHIEITKQMRVLDLGCGKGAVSVKLAQALGLSVTGIDIVQEFIGYARTKAYEHAVDNLCKFKVEDINQSVQHEHHYDITILGAVSGVLGTPQETLSKLRATVRAGGYIFIDDAYGADDSNPLYPSRQQWLSFFEKAGLELVAESCIDDSDLEEVNDYNQNCIVERANELKELYPEKAQLFDGYIESQQAECDELESEITGVTWLLRAK